MTQAEQIYNALALVLFLAIMAGSVAGIAHALAQQDIKPRNPKSYDSYGTGEPNDPQRFDHP